MPKFCLCKNPLPLPKQSNFKVVNFKKHDLDELLTWVHMMVSRDWSADTLFWHLSIDYDMDVQ